MDTKTRILETAIQLFNERGTHSVTTNHIAEGLGISPGNLYYHFKNKEEIIRAIFERLSDTTDKAFGLPADRMPTLADLEGLLERNFQILWAYRFFYREQLALLQRDPELAVRVREVRQRGFEGFRELFAAFSQAGVLKRTSATNVDDLARLCWLISDFWLISLELDHQPITPQAFEHGLRLIRLVLEPHLKGTP